MEIISKTNPLFIEIKELLKSSKNTSKVVVTDIAILEVLKNINKPVETLLYCSKLLHSQLAVSLLKYYEKNAKNIYEISEKTYLSLTLKENAQGFLAVVPFSFASLDSIIDKTNILVVDGIETPGNLGTILRSAHCTKVDAIIDVDCKTSFTNPKTVASSRGTLFLLPIIRCSYKECNEFLLKNNFSIYLGEPDLGKDYQSYDYKEKLAIVVGSERYGINKSWYDFPHKEVFIPMEGVMNSLNVSVAASILMYEVYMKRRK